MHKKISLLLLFSLISAPTLYCANEERSEASTQKQDAQTMTNYCTDPSIEQLLYTISESNKNLAITNKALTKRNFCLTNQIGQLTQELEELSSCIEQQRQECIAQCAPQQHRPQSILRQQPRSTVTIKPDEANINETTTTHIAVAPRKKSSWLSKVMLFTTGAITALTVYHNKERIKDFAEKTTEPLKDFIAHRIAQDNTAILNVVAGKYN